MAKIYNIMARWRKPGETSQSNAGVLLPWAFRDRTMIREFLDRWLTNYPYAPYRGDYIHDWVWHDTYGGWMMVYNKDGHIVCELDVEETDIVENNEVPFIEFEEVVL